MTGGNLAATAQMLMAADRGLLAADEIVAVLTRRLESCAIVSNASNRRATARCCSRPAASASS